MNESVVTITLLVVFAMAQALLAARLERIWGVDVSRMTPAAQYAKGKSAVRMLVHDTLACLPYALVCGAGAARLGQRWALAALALCACALGLLRFMSLFVSVRHGAACLADIASEEIGMPLRRLVHLLTLGAVIPALAAAMYLSGCFVLRLEPMHELALGEKMIYACLLLCMLQALLPADLQAKDLRSEGEAAPLSMGCTLILGMAAALVIVLDGRSLWAVVPFAVSVPEGLMTCLRCLLCLFAMERLLRLGGAALCGLLKRSLPRRKPNRLAVPAAIALVFAAAGALAYVDYAAALPLAAVCAAALTAVAVLSFALWFLRIGRRML